MRRRHAIAAAVVTGAAALTAAAAIVAVGVVAPRAGDPSGGPGPAATGPQEVLGVSAVGSADAAEQARAFLDDWVEDGRVVRRDEGGDTVSEGQAYGLLAGVIAGDESAFDDVWTWTQDNLVREDGLLGWQWADGDVVDDEPATDADLDTARALVIAGDRFDRPDLTEAGIELGDVILDDLTATTGFGRVLLPGLWAADLEPLPYNPSYASPAAFAILGAASGDPRWGELTLGSAAVTQQILAQTDLPPDWAQLGADGSIAPMPGPFGEGDPVQYGFDAPRLALRYAESCDAADVALASELLPALSYEDEPAARLDLGGGALTEDRSPLSVVARAAAAAASGESANGTDDLELAAEVSDRFPTYYGRAWVMLGSAMLTDTALGGCAALEARS